MNSRAAGSRTRVQQKTAESMRQRSQKSKNSNDKETENTERNRAEEMKRRPCLKEKNMHASKRLRQRQTRRNAPQRHRHCDNRSTNIPRKTGNNMIQKSLKSKNSSGSDKEKKHRKQHEQTPETIAQHHGERVGIFKIGHCS